MEQKINELFEDFLAELEDEGFDIDAAIFIYTVPKQSLTPYFILKPNIYQTAVHLMHVSWMYFRQSFKPAYSVVVTCGACAGGGYEVIGRICTRCGGSGEVVDMQAIKDLKRATHVTAPTKISNQD